jgi:hypothetical protein
MKTRSDVLDIVENESESAKHQNGTRRPLYNPKRVWERKTCKLDPTPYVPPKMGRERKTLKRDLTPPVPLKMSLEARNMKTGPDVLGTDENEFGSAKHENGTRYRPKRVR